MHGTSDTFERIGIYLLEDTDNICLLGNEMHGYFPEQAYVFADDEEND